MTTLCSLNFSLSTSQVMYISRTRDAMSTGHARDIQLSHSMSPTRGVNTQSSRGLLVGPPVPTARGAGGALSSVRTAASLHGTP